MLHTFQSKILYICQKGYMVRLVSWIPTARGVNYFFKPITTHQTNNISMIGLLESKKAQTNAPWIQKLITVEVYLKNPNVPKTILIKRYLLNSSRTIGPKLNTKAQGKPKRNKTKNSLMINQSILYPSKKFHRSLCFFKPNEPRTSFFPFLFLRLHS